MKFKFIVCFIAILAMVGANSCSKEQDIDSKKGETVSLNDFVRTVWICIDGGVGAGKDDHFYFQDGDRLFLSDRMFRPSDSIRPGGYKALVTFCGGKDSYPYKGEGWNLDKWTCTSSDGIIINSHFMYTFDKGELDLFNYSYGNMGNGYAYAEGHLIGTVQVSGNEMLLSYKIFGYKYKDIKDRRTKEVSYESPVFTAKFRKDDGKM